MARDRNPPGRRTAMPSRTAPLTVEVKVLAFRERQAPLPRVARPDVSVLDASFDDLFYVVHSDK